MTHHSGERRPERGSAAVEFALILPLFMLLVLGSLDWGYYFFVTQVVTNAAREGARAGTLDPTDDSLAVSDATSTASTYLTKAGLTGTAQVNATLVGNAVRVDVSYPAGSLTGFTEIIIPDAVTVRAEMRRF